MRLCRPGRTALGRLKLWEGRGNAVGDGLLVVSIGTIPSGVGAGPAALRYGLLHERGERAPVEQVVKDCVEVGGHPQPRVMR